MAANLTCDVARDVETQPLCQRATDHAQSKTEQASRVILVVVWMLLSSVIVMFNKWVFSNGGFPYPLALVSMHMTSCFVAFGCVRKFAPNSLKLTIMPDADVEIPWPLYARNFLGISLFYAGTLGTGNCAYLFSSV